MTRGFLMRSRVVAYATSTALVPKFMGAQNGDDAAAGLWMECSFKDRLAALRSNHLTSGSICWVRFFPPMSCPNGREWKAAEEEETLHLL